MVYLDGRIGDKLKRTNDEKEQTHDIFVALNHLRIRQPDFRLNLKLIDIGRSLKLHEHQRERNHREYEKEKENGVAVEEVVGLASRVIEP